MQEPTTELGEFADLVARIQSHDESAEAELNRILNRGVRFFLKRRLGNTEIESKVQETLSMVVKSIRAGNLDDPTRLLGLVRTILYQQVAKKVEESGDVRNRPGNVMALRDRGSVDVAIRMVSELSPKDREVLTRYYLHRQTQEQICREMKLSVTQFMLLKSRAKARLKETGRRPVESESGKLFECGEASA